MKKIYFIIILIILSKLTTIVAEASKCNGSENFCSKRFNEVMQLVTHNSTSTDQKRLFGIIPNPTADQHNGLQQQLRDGIRAFKIPIHLNGTTAWISHTLPSNELNDWLDNNIQIDFIRDQIKSNIGDQLWRIDAANQSLEDFLREIKNFLDKNPQDIITLFLNVFIPNDQLGKITDLFNKTGLTNYIHNQQVNQEWPTFEQMIKNNKRLVIFADSPVPGVPFSRNFIIENKYSFKSFDELNNDLKNDTYLKQRVQNFPYRKSGIGLMTHFITSGLAGSDTKQILVNLK